MKSKKRLQFEEFYLNTIPTCSNEELLERYTYLARGDDYDGGFTDEGIEEFDALKDELSKRLLEIKFIFKSIKEIMS